MTAFDYAGTTSLVTGASSGLGEEFARQLAARGGDLVLVARSADRLEALAEDLRARHRVTVTTLPADLSLPAEVSRVAAQAATTEIDVLVNNAGFGTYGTFADLDAGRELARELLAEPGGGSRHQGRGARIIECSHAVRPFIRA